MPLTKAAINRWRQCYTQEILNSCLEFLFQDIEEFKVSISVDDVYSNVALLLNYYDQVDLTELKLFTKSTERFFECNCLPNDVKYFKVDEQSVGPRLPPWKLVHNEKVQHQRTIKTILKIIPDYAWMLETVQKGRFLTHPTYNLVKLRQRYFTQNNHYINLAGESVNDVKEIEIQEDQDYIPAHIQAMDELIN